MASIQALFGDNVFNNDGSLSRSTLASHIFSNNEARQQLEAILHPAIWHEVEQQLQTLNSAYCLLVVPLLIETQQTSRVDRVLVVDTTEELQLSRTLERDQRSEEEITNIIQSQVDRQTRIKAADDVIDNTDKPQISLTEQVKSLHNKYLNLATQGKA